MFSTQQQLLNENAIYSRALRSLKLAEQRERNIKMFKNNNHYNSEGYQRPHRQNSQSYAPRDWYTDSDLAEKIRTGELAWDSPLHVGQAGKLRTVINIAARHGFLETLHEISKNPEADFNKFFSLFIAIKNGNFMAADIILEHGGNLEQEVVYNRETYPSMLFFFTDAEAKEFNGKRRAEAISYLLHRGADPDKRDSYGVSWRTKLVSSTHLHDGSYPITRFESVDQYLSTISAIEKDDFEDKFGYKHSSKILSVRY